MRDHDQSLLTKIRKFKNDKKSLQNKLEWLTMKETSINRETMIETMELEKSSEVKFLLIEKWTNVDPLKITTQKGANLVEVRISLGIEYEQG